jgi:hypothetical protein
MPSTRKKIAEDRLIEPVKAKRAPTKKGVAPSPVNDNRTGKPSETRTAQSALRRLLTVAWLAIVLGFAMQGLILAGKLSLGARPGSAQMAIDLAQGITWSFFVCAGVGLGTAIAKARASLGGLVGIVSAPLALGLAKGSQKFMASALQAAQQPAVLSFATLGVMRAIEYGVLGWALAWLVTRKEKRLGMFLLAGAGVGATFGSGITWLTIFTADANGVPLKPPQMFATGFNEIVFPIGCAIVVYVALQVGRHVKLISDPES